LSLGIHHSDEGDGSGAPKPTDHTDPSTPTGTIDQSTDVPPGTNKPSTIGDRDYSGHGLDRMQGWGVPPSAVEDAITNGGTAPGNEPGTTRHYGDNGVGVVTDDRTGTVITVIPGPYRGPDR
jgi:hypothetical protein